MPYLDDMLRLGVSEASIVRICELRKSNPDIQGTDLLAFTKIGIGEGELLKAWKGSSPAVRLRHLHQRPGIQTAEHSRDPCPADGIPAIRRQLRFRHRIGSIWEVRVLVEKTGKPEVRIPMVASGLGTA